MKNINNLLYVVLFLCAGLFISATNAHIDTVPVDSEKSIVMEC